jgi:hypothetical protein
MGVLHIRYSEQQCSLLRRHNALNIICDLSITAIREKQEKKDVYAAATDVEGICDSVSRPSSGMTERNISYRKE